MAEEVGVEPTRRFVSTSLVLKTRHPTGDVALPSFHSLSRLRIAFGLAIVRSLPCRCVKLILSKNSRISMASFRPMPSSSLKLATVKFCSEASDSVVSAKSNRVVVSAYRVALMRCRKPLSAPCFNANLREVPSRRASRCSSDSTGMWSPAVCN